MAKFTVEVYELHSQAYEVEAENRAEAIENFRSGMGTVKSAPEFIDSIEYQSLRSLEIKCPGILQEMKKTGHDVSDREEKTEIRSVHEV